MAARPDPTDGVGQLTELMRDASRAEAPRPAVDPVVRRRRRRTRGIVALLVVVAMLAGAGGYVAWALNAPLPVPAGEAQPPVVEVPAAAEVKMPAGGAAAISVAGGDEFLGPDASGIWMASGGDEPRPMASISKLVTALVILDAKPLSSADDPGPTITFSKADHDLYDKYYLQNATIAEMPIGSRMSLRDALSTMLLVSACNYAEAVSTWAFGSQSAFLAATKRWLAANGFSATRLVEPTGLDARNVSTPSELIALGKLAMANPAIAAIVATETLQVPGIPPRGNTNTLLGVDGIRGIKTGTLGPENSNLLFSSVLDVGAGKPLEITGVVMGNFSHENTDLDVRALLESIKAGFHRVTVGTSGQSLGTYTTPWGASARMVLAQDASLFTWSDTPIEAMMTPMSLKTGEKGEQLGSVTWTAGSQTVTVPVVLDATIAQPDQWWRLTHPSELGG